MFTTLSRGSAETAYFAMVKTRPGENFPEKRPENARQISLPD
jgi:hypothetical protein